MDNIVQKNFKNADYEVFNLFLLAQDWNSLFVDSNSANYLWIEFCNVLTDGIDIFEPNYPNNSKIGRKKTNYPKCLQKLLIKKKSLWRKRHEPNGDIIYRNFAHKCKTSIGKFHVRKETALLRVKKKKLLFF